jgi:hypothetical protein
MIAVCLAHQLKYLEAYVMVVVVGEAVAMD